MLDRSGGDIIPQNSGELVGVNPSLLPNLAQSYMKERFVHLPELITPDIAHQLLVSTEYVPSKKVWCGLDNVSWHEQNFDPGHPAFDFFEQRQAMDLAMTLAGRELYQGLAAWTSIYGAGEYINPHRDSSGSIQILVCLQSPPSPQNGGELVIDGAQMFLRPGDAIAFEATTLEHYTTPLAATAEEPSPRRTVLVGKYFLA